MLSNHKAAASVAVKDLNRARQFYEGTLGFPQGTQTPGGLVYTIGGSDVLLFESPTAGSNVSTVLAFEVSDEAFDDETRALRESGIDFDTFEMEGATWEGDVARLGETKSVWFHDPDGNVLAASTALAP